MTDKARTHKKRNLVYSHCQHGLKPAVGSGIELKFHPDVEIQTWKVAGGEGF